MDRQIDPELVSSVRSPGGKVVIFRDSWGAIEQQFDVAASGLPSSLVYLFAEAFREQYASAAIQSRRTYWKVLSVFARYLSSLARPITTDDLDTRLMGEYIIWLDHQHGRSGEPWSLATRHKRYATVKNLLGSLVAAKRIAAIDFPAHPFLGRHSGRPQNRLPEVQLKAILSACYGEIDAAWARFNEGQKLLAQPKPTSDPAALVQELHRLGGGVIPRSRETDRVISRMRSFGGKLEVAQYLHLTVATLTPFYVAIAIQTAANPDALRHIARDCLVPHPVDPNRVMIEWAKPRAGSAMRRAQRRSFDRRRPYAAPNLIEKLLEMTAPLAQHASPSNCNSLFLMRGNGARGISPIAQQTLSNGIEAFIARANARIATSNEAAPSNPSPPLAKFTTKQFRGSVATRHYAASGGDIRVAQGILNHSRADTTDLYVRGPEAKHIQDTTIARLQTMMVAWVAGDVQQKPPAGPTAGLASVHRANAVGHICANPLGGAGPGASPGRLCSQFLGCLACPGLVIPIDVEHLARLLQLQSALEAARTRIDAHRWQLLYSASHRILIDDILPDFPKDLHPPARHMMVKLPPLAELE